MIRSFDDLDRGLDLARTYLRQLNFQQAQNPAPVLQELIVRAVAVIKEIEEEIEKTQRILAARPLPQVERDKAGFWARISRFFCCK